MKNTLAETYQYSKEDMLKMREQINDKLKGEIIAWKLTAFTIGFFWALTLLAIIFIY